MTIQKGHLDATEILEAAKLDIERQTAYYNISKIICDMIKGKWHNRKISKRLATDAQNALDNCLPDTFASSVMGQFYVGYDNRFGMYHLEIRYAEWQAMTSKAKRDFGMSMLIAYDTNLIIDAAKVEEYNQGYLLGMERKAQILSKVNLVPQAVKTYNEAIVMLTNILESFSGVYPFSSYFKFEASKKAKD